MRTPLLLASLATVATLGYVYSTGGPSGHLGSAVADEGVEGEPATGTDAGAMDVSLTQLHISMGKSRAKHHGRSPRRLARNERQTPQT